MPKRYNPQDHYFRKAKEEGFRARSVYKLEEIQEKFDIINQGDHVLDLGAAPGSFLQIITEFIGQRGEAIGIDLQEIKSLPYPNIKTYQADILNEKELESILQNRKFEVITSDLAPKTSGIKDVDQARSVELNEEALKIAEKYLKTGGNLVLKIFRGADFDNFLRKVKLYFKETRCFKPQSSRDRSKEIYIIGMRKE